MASLRAPMFLRTALTESRIDKLERQMARVISHLGMEVEDAATILLLMSLGLASCSMTGELNPSTQAQLNTALAATCPWMALHPLLPINWPAGARTAFYVMESACPPNYPPTNVAQILAIIAAATTLRPYIR